MPNKHPISPFIIGLFLFCVSKLFAQTPSYNFHHFTPSEGLSNNAVRGIAEDKYGFIWLGTNYGLNRFDGTEVKKYFMRENDSTSVSNSFVRTLYSDRQGRLWVGGNPGFCMYNYRKDEFIRYRNADANIAAITEDDEGNVWAGTNHGLKYVNTITQTLDPVTESDTTLNKLLHINIRDLCFCKDGNFYIATDWGIVILNAKTRAWQLIEKKDGAGSLINSNDVLAIAIDSTNRLWVSAGYSSSNLICISPDRKTSVSYNYFQQPGGKPITNSIRKLMVDSKNRIWVGSTNLGLSLFVEKTNGFISFINDPTVPNSFTSAHCIQIYQDHSGMIWLSSEGNGLDYFHPDQTLFDNIQMNPYLPVTLLDNWGRVVAEDRDNNLWLGTGLGISVYNFKKGVFKNFTNRDSSHKMLHSQSIRSLVYDRDGNIWIGTADGVNRYHPATGKMDFFTEKENLPPGFTWMLTQLKDGKILAGSSRGLFLYQPATQNFFSFKDHPVLKNYDYGVHSFKEDSKGRWWIGMINNGVVVYDPGNNKVIKHLTAAEHLLSSNIIQCICESRTGEMWIGTSTGLVCYDPEKNSSEFFGLEEGLPSTWIAGLIFDNNGRLWIGTVNGLAVMNPQKKIIRSFDLADGLPTTQFNEQDPFKTKDGLIIFPTYKGFVYFRPEQFNWGTEQPAIYLTHFLVNNKDYRDSVNLEELSRINLRYNENFLSFRLTGLNYGNPKQCYYAYKLDGFDKEWIFTRKDQVNYTNIPGGHYIFRYKLTLDPTNWNSREKEIAIHIGTIFYKAVWFWLLLGISVITFLYWFYRYRIYQKERVFILQNKAQTLEKEKAMVKYEGLKQQLNPHFLFNSLTSLRSLINSDPKTAGDFLDYLSKTYRYILKSRDSETVLLGDEIKFAQNYIKLQQTRFEKGFEVPINVPVEFHERNIVPVTLQNLIENAIKHNIIDEDTPLIVNIFVQDDYLIVQNNLQKKNFVETSNRQGLVNMRSLYHYLSDRPVEIIEKDHYFIVKIPLL